MKRMMRWATLAVASGMLLAACSKTTDVVEPASEQGGISFTPFVANSLRGTEVGITELKGSGFTVTAFGPNQDAFFSNVLVKPETTGDLWAPDNQVIPWPGFELDFIAHANLGTSTPAYATPTIAKDASTMALVTPDKVSEQVDVIVARDKGNRAQHGTSGVPLNFKHILSQIEVQAKNTNAAYKIKVAGVKLGRIKSTATFTYPTDTKQATSIDNQYSAHNAPKVFAAASSAVVELDGTTAKTLMNATHGNFMLIPQTVATAWDPAAHLADATSGDNQGTYLSVLLNITTANGAAIYPLDKDKYAWAATGFSITDGLKPGKKYVITLDFSEGAGYEDPEKGQPTTIDGLPSGVTIEENPVGSGNDKPGNPILSNQPIKFTVTVENFTEVKKDISMKTTN